jgi:hypothetical protein
MGRYRAGPYTGPTHVGAVCASVGTGPVPAHKNISHRAIIRDYTAGCCSLTLWLST